jgi:succinate dehydrogenase/fumarate reductase flavoprotein subunit
MHLGDGDKCISTDVLVVGGGKAGCFAAINAAEEGAKVVLFEKADIRRCGDTGSGLFHMPLIHPDYNFPYEEFAKLNVEGAGGIADEDVSLVFAQDSLDRLLDLESYGVKIRKDDSSFVFMKRPGKGDETKPDRSKLANILSPGLGVWWNVQPILARKVISYQNVTVLNRTAAIGLLTKDGEIGGDVIGAIGLETRTGKFVICDAKAVIITTGGAHRLGRQKDSLYAPTRFISVGPATNCGEGMAMAYRAGADIINMEFPLVSFAWKDFAHAGFGPTVMTGRIIDGKGRVVTDARKSRLTPFEFLSFYLRSQPTAFQTIGPIYSDASEVPGYPEEKDIFKEYIWSMVTEATTAVGLDLWMKQRGEDYRKAPMEMEWRPISILNNQGGIHMDANGRSNLNGLYCAGATIGGGWRHASTGAFVFGARAGRNAAEYAKKAPESKINVEQTKREKSYILEALSIRPEDGYSWIELEDKAREIATEYGPPLTSNSKLERGLIHLERIQTNYLPKIFARNPREMIRASEVRSIFVLVEAFLKAALFRKESRIIPPLSIIYKTDFPEHDDKNWLKHTVIHNIRGEMKLDARDVKRLR